tara:strand:+ start:336 stop:566 length:231 start_codon:yes stop_codon:yes gene_type:complete
MKKSKIKKITKELQSYTDVQLGYFQAMNDMDEFMTDSVVDKDYVDHLLGDVNNSYDGVQMDTEFNDLDGDSDWFMD